MLASACTGPPPSSEGEKAPSGGLPPWGSVLGGSGGSAADTLVALATPPCLVFGDRESLAMQLLLERRGGNRFPDSDRDVSTSAERTLTIACP